MAPRVIRHRRNQCPVIIEAGGGYGGAITERLRDNNAPATAFNGVCESTERHGAKLAFHNKRAAAW
jgi:hypothetical protein